VNQVSADTELFAEGMLGKTPTGGNITTYKELCSLASDLNQPDMIYQFMQLANHNATWTSKLGAAFGLKTLSAESRQKMQPYLGRIIPRLYRYKYDPTPKIQNSMISIWDTIVSDSKEVTERYYWEILRELLDNRTSTRWLTSDLKRTQPVWWWVAPSCPTVWKCTRSCWITFACACGIRQAWWRPLATRSTPMSCGSTSPCITRKRRTMPCINICSLSSAVWRRREVSEQRVCH